MVAECLEKEKILLARQPKDGLDSSAAFNASGCCVNAIEDLLWWFDAAGTWRLSA